MFISQANVNPKPNVCQNKKHSEHITVGSIQNVIGSAISLPTGLITAAFLSRKLGPLNYGTLSVTASIIVLIEAVITLGANRSTEKLVAESNDWRSVTIKSLQFQLFVSFLASFFLVLVAPFLEHLLNTADLSFYLRIYSVSIPISALNGIHQAVLVGRGNYRAKALLNCIYWIVRLLLILVFVTLQPTITAVIISNVFSSFLVLLISKYLIKTSIIQFSAFPFRMFWKYTGPMFFYTIATMILNYIALFFVKALGEQPQTAGYYAASHNLTIIPALIAISISPLLLAKTTYLLSKNQFDLAQSIKRNMERFTICLLPFASLSAGASLEIVTAIYGSSFQASGPLLAILIFGAIGKCLKTIAVSTLIAIGKPKLPAIFITPLVPIAIITYYYVIPCFGALGAAVTSAVVSWLAALLVMVGAYQLWKTTIPFFSFVRSVFISVPVYYLATAWETPGFLLLVKLPVICLLITFAYAILGEFSLDELKRFRSLANQRLWQAGGEI